MADKLAIMAELAKRGKLPADKAALFAEAQKRGLVPGAGPSPAIKAGQDIAYAGQQDNQKPSPNLLDASLATVNGLTSSVPFLQETSDALLAGGKTAMDAVTGKPADFGAAYNGIRASRDAVAQKAPLANTAGDVAGTLGTFGALSLPKAGAEAIGLTGKLGQRLLNSTLSTAGYEGVKGLSHGDTGGKLLVDEAMGAAGGAAGGIAGNAVEKTGQTVANLLTKSAQRDITDTAIKGAPAAADLKSAASRLFESSTGGNPVAVSSDAFDRLMGSIQGATAKFRPNAANDPQAVGLLSHLSELAQASKTPGVVVDLKDLHLAQQLANKVAQSPNGRDSAIASIINGKIDEFMKGLKPSDILGGSEKRFVGMDEGDKQFQWSWNRSPETGMAAAKFGDRVYVARTHEEAVQKAIHAEGDGVKAQLNENPEKHLGYQVSAADPRQAATDLLRGKSLWSRAKKVSLVEDAVTAADTYKSGFENGLQLSFHKLMKTDEFQRFSAPEQAAIREVAKGTTKQNVASLLGRMGISIGGHGAHNIISGGLGTTALTAVLAPVLGPAAFPAALTATTVVGAAGRRAAEQLATKGASRATQVMATPGIKTAAQRPNMLAPASVPLQLLIRGGATNTAN